MAKPSRPTATNRAVVPAHAVPWWSKPGGAAAVVAALAFVAFARSLGNEFTYDEGLVIVRAQGFLQSSSFGTLFSPRYFGASQEGTWRPLCTLTYMLDAAISMHPAMFKLANLAWHIGTAWLLMALARRLLPGELRRYAVVAGLFFVLHPVTTETVDNASFREDSLVTFFTLATLLLAIGTRRAKAASPPQPIAGGSEGKVGAPTLPSEYQVRHPFWSLLTFVLGLLSKESAVVAPVLLALIRLMRLGNDPAPLRPDLKALAAELAPYTVVAVVYLAIRFGPMAIPIEYANYPGDTFIATLAGLPAIWAHDIRLVLLPWPLCADYTGFFRFGRQPAGPLAGALAIVLAYVALPVWAARSGQRVLAFGLGWFLIALLPVSNLLPIPIPAAERFLYLPLAGVAIAVAAGAGLLARLLAPRERQTARRLATAGGAIVLATYVVLVNVRHGDWRNDQVLWRATVATNPHSCGAQSAVGGDLLSRGMESGATDLLREAAARQELALSLCPERSDVYRTAISYTRLGAARVLLGDLPAGRAALERATVLFPGYALPVAWLGYVAFVEGDLNQAAGLLKRAIIDMGPPDGAVAAVAQRYVDKI